MDYIIYLDHLGENNPNMDDEYSLSVEAMDNRACEFKIVDIVSLIRFEYLRSKMLRI